MIRIIKANIDLIDLVRTAKRDLKKIGFVPTMGAIHEGHLSLIRKSGKESDICISSVFVNPTQFNDKDDFRKYPRMLDKDIKMLEQTGCDIVFCPDEEEIYHDSIKDKIKIDLGHLDKILEGEFRPGHFDGVVTIVKKFFDLVQPDKAYFGQKDYQQFLVIKKLISAHSYDIELVMCPIVRENDGLAMSSRNVHLNEEERKTAPLIYDTLMKAKNLLKEKSITEIENWAKERFSNEKIINFQYFEILNANNLLPLQTQNEAENIVICVSVKVGKVSLIDNILTRENVN